MNRYDYLLQNKNNIIQELSLLADYSVDDYISFTNKYLNINGLTIFQRWEYDGTVNWKNYILNGLEVSLVNLSNTKKAKLSDIHIGTLYNFQLGKITKNNNIINKLETGLNIKLNKVL